MLSFVLILPCILSSQFHTIVYRGFWTNAALKEDAPTNYDQHKECISTSPEALTKLMTFIEDSLKKVDEKMLEIENPDGRAAHLADRYITVLYDARKFMTKHIPKTLIPYIKESYLEELYEKFIVRCKIVYVWIDRFHGMEQYDLDIDSPIETKVFEVTELLKEVQPDFTAVLLYSFITLSCNAEFHRKIHLENDEDGEWIEEDCALCQKPILPNNYVFSLLCRHQLHIECLKTDFSKNNTKACFNCNKNFWDGLN
ncbi:hypothetical protein SLOPH_696 [Spraguea lophii 42_110]|uniref:RING-type domain-containing protein n=1 Tax=Spraguea lophii (strain 42_110) TaxID=1358809 RepID=S7W4T3_SPRLO|nr:hypothetical protein SLOPH_696 [Spraguea lophii 42_110]